MTKIFHDPGDFAEEALAGFCDIHSGLVRQVPGGAVRRHRPARPKVTVLAGGGSGHYPAFAGLIGSGLADGAVVGNIFTSPSAQQAYAAQCVAALEATRQSLHNAEGWLGDLDAVAGDGDHGLQPGLMHELGQAYRHPGR